jgi:hypothetical protein
VRVKVRFGGGPRPKSIPSPDLEPRAARLLALAHYIEERIRAGEIEDLAAVARATGLTRARITQVMNLGLLAPEVQTAVASRVPITERELRALAAEPDWQAQVARWRRIPDRRIA